LVLFQKSDASITAPRGAIHKRSVIDNGDRKYGPDTGRVMRPVRSDYFTELPGTMRKWR
jgi:hypothetical protein